MSWYNPASWFRGQSSASVPAHDDWWFNVIGMSGGPQQPVTPMRALQSSVVYACIKVISESIATLPFDLFHRAANGDKTKLDGLALFDVLHNQANDEHTSQEWREIMLGYAAWRGTAVSEILPGRRGAVDQLVPVHPDHFKVERVRDNQGRVARRFIIAEPGAPERAVDRSELFILRALVLHADGVRGIDPLTAQANAIGARIASQDFARRFVENDATPPLIMEHPSYFKTDDDREKWIKAWQRGGTGENRGKVRVAEFGMKPHPISLTQEQSQFLETQKYQDIDIARIYRVQLHKIGILDRATFSNIEQQSVEFVVDTLRPWMVRLESAVKRDLIRGMFPDWQTMFAEHNVRALLVGETLSRFRAYAIARNWGWMSANDVRRAENQNSIGPEGDVYLQPLNMAPAGDPAEPSGMGREPLDEPTRGNGAEHPRPSAATPKTWFRHGGDDHHTGDLN